MSLVDASNFFLFFLFYHLGRSDMRRVVKDKRIYSFEEVVSALNIRVPKGYEIYSFSVPTRGLKGKCVSDYELVVKLRRCSGED